MFGYQGRSLSNTGLRYITILLGRKNNPKSSDWNTLDYEQTVYITEGPVRQSSCSENAIAMAGADASPGSLDLGSPVFVYDNDHETNRLQTN